MPNENTLSKTDIEKKVEDWETRIQSLYASVKDWLPSGYTVKEQSEVTMFEELMQQYDVPPKQLKVLDIYNANRIIATFKPIGLWVIGANGRVDVLSKKGAILLVDKAEKFQTPNWLSYTKDKSESTPFDKEYFLNILAGC
ncbi:MAG: hypothetical protein PHQ03_01595 [Methylococcales bacterium]|nr:hypothetical protein [Methylococcales bacterium]